MYYVNDKLDKSGNMVVTFMAIYKKIKKKSELIDCGRSSTDIQELQSRQLKYGEYNLLHVYLLITLIRLAYNVCYVRFIFTMRATYFFVAIFLLSWRS